MIGTRTLPRESLAGQVGVVTGAGRSIGFEAARALAVCGAIDNHPGLADSKKALWAVHSCPSTARGIP